jgi:small subunit ribosomal protein S5
MPRIEVATDELEEKVISLNRVQKVRKGGRTLRWSALVCVGDGRGHVGVGLGKASEVPDAIRKGSESAKKSMFTIPLIQGSIPHEIQEDAGAAKVLLKPASPGTGVIAGGAVRAIVEVAGVRDILTKSLGSSNAVNIAWATVNCLKGLRTAEQVAGIRGKTVEEIGCAPRNRGEKP